MKKTIISLLVLFAIFISLDSIYICNLLEQKGELMQTIDSLKYELEDMNVAYTELEASYVKAVADNEDLLAEYTKAVDGKNAPKLNYTDEELILLAKCVQAEAGVGKLQSQKLITQVIMNRVNDPRFPNTIHDVIYATNGKVHQFSVAYNGMLDNAELRQETLITVYNTLLSSRTLPSYVFYFYDVNVTQNWVNTLNIFNTVEGTVFAYSTKDKERYT